VPLALADRRCAPIRCRCSGCPPLARRRETCGERDFPRDDDRQSAGARHGRRRAVIWSSVVVDAYMFTVPVAGRGMLAVPAATLGRYRGFRHARAGAVASRRLRLLGFGGKPLWRENRREHREDAACPRLRSCARGWTLGPGQRDKDGATARNVVFERAYRRLAAEQGFAVRFIGPNRRGPGGVCWRDRSCCGSRTRRQRGRGRLAGGTVEEAGMGAPGLKGARRLSMVAQRPRAS